MVDLYGPHGKENVFSAAWTDCVSVNFMVFLGATLGATLDGCRSAITGLKRPRSMPLSGPWQPWSQRFCPLGTYERFCPCSAQGRAGRTAIDCIAVACRTISGQFSNILEQQFSPFSPPSQCTHWALEPSEFWMQIVL